MSTTLQFHDQSPSEQPEPNRYHPTTDHFNIEAISSVCRGEVSYSTSQNETAPNDTANCESFGKCPECHAEALAPELLQKTIATCKAILKSHPFASRNAASPSLVSRSNPNSTAVQSKLQASPDSEQVREQQKAKIDEVTLITHETFEHDEEHAGDRTKDKAKQKKHRHTSPTKLRKGCKTCKSRRVKCDGKKPECLRCMYGGYVCEGNTFPQRNDINGAVVDIVKGRSDHGSADENYTEDAPHLEPFLPTQRTSSTSTGASERPFPPDQLCETIREESKSGMVATEDVEQLGLHLRFTSYIADPVQPILMTKGNTSVKEIKSNNSQVSQSSVSRHSSSTAHSFGLGRRLLDVVTSLILLEDVIRPETFQTIAKYDPGLCEVVIHLLLESASQFSELGGSVACKSSDMMALVGLIEGVPPFERKSHKSSQQSGQLWQRELVIEIERNVDLLMDLTTTIEDVANDPNGSVVVPLQHTSRYCVKHLASQPKTQTAPKELPLLTVRRTSDLAGLSSLNAARIPAVSNPGDVPTSSGPHINYPSLAENSDLLKEWPDGDVMNSLQFPLARHIVRHKPRLHRHLRSPGTSRLSSALAFA